MATCCSGGRGALSVHFLFSCHFGAEGSTLPLDDSNLALFCSPQELPRIGSEAQLEMVIRVFRGMFVATFAWSL